MIKIAVDHRKDAGTMKRLNSIAASIFQRYSLSFAAAKRAGGYLSSVLAVDAQGFLIRMQPARDPIRAELA